MLPLLCTDCYVLNYLKKLDFHCYFHSWSVGLYILFLILKAFFFTSACIPEMYRNAGMYSCLLKFDLQLAVSLLWYILQVQSVALIVTAVELCYFFIDSCGYKHCMFEPWLSNVFTDVLRFPMVERGHWANI